MEKKEWQSIKLLSKGVGATVGGLLSISSSWFNIDSVVNAVTSAEGIVSPAMNANVSWPLGKVAFSLLPLAGTFSCQATVKDTIWMHNQIQGVVNVNIPVQQMVIKLSEVAGSG
eukprot:2147536-Ditylum_brightwellii.AAC.1